MSSHTTNSNSKRHVSNETDTNSFRPIQSTQKRLTATNQYGLDVTDRTTYSTRSYTHKNAARSSAQSNIIQPNKHGFDFGGHSSQINTTIPGMESIDFRPNSQSNDIGSRAYMSHYVRRTLSGLSSEAWDRYRARYPTQNRLPKVHTNVLQYSQMRPHWYRIVSIDVNEEESNASLSSPQSRKFQRTTYGRYNTAGVNNSQSDVEWYRKVNRDVIESLKSTLSSRSERLEHRTTSRSQHPTPPITSYQASSTHSWPASSIDTHQTSSQIEPTSLPSESDGYQSANVIHTTIPLRQLQNLNSNQSPAVSISTNSENSATQDTALFPSINMNDYPNRAQVLIDLDDFSAEDQSLIASSISSSSRRGPVTRNIIGIIPTPQINSTGIVEPEILEVIIRSRDNPDYSIVLADPNIIRMHRILQRCILSSTSNTTTLYQQVNDYMRVLRNTILSRDNHSSSVSFLMGSSVPRMLTIDQSEFPVLEKSSKMPPITTVDRIKNGVVVKELTNCAICLEEDNGNVLLEPCMHYNMCESCMKKLKTWICPICRSHITNITIYV